MSLTKKDLVDIRDVVLDALDYAVAPRLDSLENHMNRLEGSMDKLDMRMAGLDSRVSSTDSRMNSLEIGQYETNRRLSAIETLVEGIDGRTIALQNDVIELYKM